MLEGIINLGAWLLEEAMGEMCPAFNNLEN